MKINVSGGALVFKNEGQYGTYYRTSLSKKKLNGDGYDRAPITIKFMKGNEPTAERTKIEIEEGFLSFNVTKEGKPNGFYIMCMKYSEPEAYDGFTPPDSFAEAEEEMPF